MRRLLVFLLTISALLAGIIYADSGSYKFSKHADPSIGVNRDPDLPRGDCSQCHIQHNPDTPFDFALFTEADNGACLSSGCHEYEYQWPPGDFHWSYPGNVPDWYNSGHGASSSLFPPGTGREVRLCVQCHNPHGAGDSLNGVYPSATSYLEEKGCYSSNGISGQGCHGMNSSYRPTGAADIYSQLLKLSRHDVESAAKVHSSDWQLSLPYGREPRTTNSGYFTGSNRHVECVDCHNPHKATSEAHAPGTNQIGGPLLGSWGVEPSSVGPWNTPTSFSVVDFTSIRESREYQLCYKCHSYYAFGNTPPTGYSDIAREFNPANESYHPMQDTVRTNSYTSPTTANGFVETMEPPWDNGLHDLMTCSDCHASETESDPRGPHGSNYAYILIGSPSTTDVEFCTRCHKASIYAPISDPGFGETGSRFDEQTTGNHGASHYFHVRESGYGCRQCHGARQNSPPSMPEQRTPYAVELGSAHGSNAFSGLLNGANINLYSPGSCTPTCHGKQTYIAGPE